MFIYIAFLVQARAAANVETKTTVSNLVSKRLMTDTILLISRKQQRKCSPVANEIVYELASLYCS